MSNLLLKLLKENFLLLLILYNKSLLKLLKFTAAEELLLKDKHLLSYNFFRHIKALRPTLFTTELELHAQQIKENRSLPVEIITLDIGLKESDNFKIISYAITDFKAKLCKILEGLITHEQIFYHENKVRIKISGDGFQRSKSRGQVVLNFCIVDTNHPHSSLSTWDIAICNSAEDYNSIEQMTTE